HDGPDGRGAGRCGQDSRRCRARADARRSEQARRHDGCALSRGLRSAARARHSRSRLETSSGTRVHAAAGAALDAGPMTDIADTHPRTSRSLKYPAILGGLAALLALAFVVSLATGAVPVSVGDVVRSLLGMEVDGRTAAVIQMIRLPRAFLAVIVGAALAGAGAAFQGLFRNPLADPSLIGVSGGAALGAVVIIVFGSAVATALPFF